MNSKGKDKTIAGYGMKSIEVSEASAGSSQRLPAAELPPTPVQSVKPEQEPTREQLVEVVRDACERRKAKEGAR